jgi:hypothetical protein
MRLLAVHDASGRIVAAAPVREADDDTPQLTPLAGPRQTAVELEVPDDVAGEELDVICTTMRVDAESNQLTRVDEGGWPSPI